MKSQHILLMFSSVNNAIMLNRYSAVAGKKLGHKSNIYVSGLKIDEKNSYPVDWKFSLNFS